MKEYNIYHYFEVIVNQRAIILSKSTAKCSNAPNKVKVNSKGTRTIPTELILANFMPLASFHTP